MCNSCSRDADTERVEKHPLTYTICTWCGVVLSVDEPAERAPNVRPPSNHYWGEPT
jgi:hypothetical protein